MAMIDLHKLNIEQLKDLDKQVVQQIAASKQREFLRMAEQIKETAKSLDMSVQQLLEQAGILNQKQKKAKGAPSSGGKGQPLYRNLEDSSKTWSGRGRPPGWVAKYQEAGGKLDDLRIKD